MGKQRKQRQQPSKKKVQVKQKLAKQDPTCTAKKPADAMAPMDAKNICVYGLNNLGNTCFFNSALQASPHNISSTVLPQENVLSFRPGAKGGSAEQNMCHSSCALAITSA